MKKIKYKDGDGQRILDTLDFLKHEYVWFGENVRVWRVKNNVSLRKMSELMNKEYSAMRICQVEYNTHPPTRDFICLAMNLIARYPNSL